MRSNLVISYKTPMEYDEFFTEQTIGCRTKNITLFKNIVKFVHSILDKVNFGFEPDGIHITTMDQSHISFIDCLIPKELFSNYNCGSGNGVVKGIDLNCLSKILNHLKIEDDFIMSFETDCDAMDIKFINTRYTKFYTMKLMVIDQDNLDICDLGEISEITIDSKYFDTIMHEFADIGENFRFKILENKEKISLKCDGDMTSLKMVLQDEEITYKHLKDIELFFNIEHIQKFTRGNSINKKAEIKIAHNLPIQLSYSILSTGYIHYYVAPRIED